MIEVGRRQGTVLQAVGGRDRRKVRAAEKPAVVREITCDRAEASLASWRDELGAYDKSQVSPAGDDQCLFDALALLEFLATRRLYPDWIFGVQAQPFGAPLLGAGRRHPGE